MTLTLDAAIRLTELLLSLALLQQCIEHLAWRRHGFETERTLFLARAALAGLLILGVAAPWPLVGLAALSLVILVHFQGPYNGGSDRMGLLALWCLLAASLAPTTALRELAFGYLGVQLVLSYVIAGWVKILNPQWRRALGDVFLFSAYPVSENLRRWSDKPRLLLILSWAVMLFELAFPLVLLNQHLLWVGLLIAASFHLANACLFGFNRFFWTWLSVYPALIWLQGRIT